MIAVLWGLLAAVMSTAGMTLWFLVEGQWPGWHLKAWLASMASGTLNVVVLYLLYLALRRGPVSVASPAASTFTVMLVGWNIAAGEPWLVTQLGAVALVFFGVIMLARKSSSPGIDDQYDAKWIRDTALLGLAAALAVSVRMFLAQDAGVAIGAANALYLNRIFALIASSVVVGYLLIKHTKVQWPSGRIYALIAVQGGMEACALGVFLVGSAGTGRIGASIGFSAFAAVTAIVASVWLGEKIGRTRTLWITVIVAGLMLASAGSIE